MGRLLFGATHLMLAMAFTMPGCGKNSGALQPTPPSKEPPGLPVGMAAPEIAGEDIDGVPFQLSEYRGQVVLLDFWGNW